MSSPPSYLVIGEAVADIVEATDGRRTTHPGGSPMNVAYGLGRLQCRTTLITQLGNDPHGRTIRSHLAGAEVEVIDVANPDQATATATAVLDETGAAHYLFDISWSSCRLEVVPTTTHVHTGSIAAYLSPGAEGVEQLLTVLRASATVSLDPNIRPALVGDHTEVVRRTERLVALADIVKASDEDIHWLYPDQDPVDVAHRWVRLGSSLVVVTRGAAGALAVTPAGVMTVPPVTVTVVDTVAAGDSFMAALLDGLGSAGLLGAAARPRLQAHPLGRFDAILARAATAAAITVTRAGADPPSARELDASAPSIASVDHAGRRSAASRA